MQLQNRSAAADTETHCTASPPVRRPSISPSAILNHLRMCYRRDANWINHAAEACVAIAQGCSWPSKVAQMQAAPAEGSPGLHGQYRHPAQPSAERCTATKRPVKLHAPAAARRQLAAAHLSYVAALAIALMAAAAAAAAHAGWLAAACLGGRQSLRQQADEAVSRSAAHLPLSNRRRVARRRLAAGGRRRQLGLSPASGCDVVRSQPRRAL